MGDLLEQALSPEMMNLAWRCLRSDKAIWEPVLFTRDRKAAEKALAFLAERLQELGLELHQEKTRVIESGPEVVFLGQPLPRPPKKAA